MVTGDGVGVDYGWGRELIVRGKGGGKAMNQMVNRRRGRSYDGGWCWELMVRVGGS